VGTALQALAKNFDLHDQGGVPVLDVQGKSTRLGYAIHQSHVEAIDHIYDLSIAVGCRIMRQLCGAGWNPAEVHFSRRQQPDLNPTDDSIGHPCGSTWIETPLCSRVAG
jgi:hypothetical protein